MTKVLFMLSSMNVGGVEKSLLSLLSKMPKAKYNITLLLLEKKGGFLKFVPEWVKVEKVEWFKTVKPVIMQPPQETIKSFIKNKQALKVPMFVYSYFISKRLDNIYIYYKNIFKGIPTYKKYFDVAISYQGPTDIIDYYVANKVNATVKISWVHFDVSKHVMNKKLYINLYKKFDRIYVVSNNAREKLLTKIPQISDKTEVFHNLILNQKIKQMSKEEVQFDEKYKGIKIVTIGRLSEEKGQNMAIKALYKLRESGYNVKWYCIGDGKQKEIYKKLISENGLQEQFILLGSISNPYPFIARSNLYVQTSRHEGYCLTLAEAKYLNKPIVTTDFIGASEQIINGYNGSIVENSYQGIYKGIKDILDNPGMADTFIQRLSVNVPEDNTSEIRNLYQYMDRARNVQLKDVKV